MLTVGTGQAVTVTVVLAVAVPPGPVQEMEKVVLEESAEEASDPDVALPVAKPAPAVAVHEVALDDDQLRVVVWPV
jgi:hypothetical protein